MGSNSTLMHLPVGYLYASIYAGIRKTPQDDLALIVSEGPASAAGVFTQNLVQAAPVKLAKAHLRKSHGMARAILVNAGNANCATVTGDAVAVECCTAVAKSLNVAPEEVLSASTGVIGVELDPGLVTNHLDSLIAGLSPDRFEDVARAILTTDLTMKIASEEVALSSGSVRIAGMTKGSGMIQPKMATTLGFVLTDAAITIASLRRMLTAGVARSWNRISVDGDTSTNDTVFLLANGASDVSLRPQDREPMTEALGSVMESLAIQIARDGEGARKLITIEVIGAADEDAADRVARGIANSPLVKTAIAGSDPNWGRILSAAGNTGVKFDPRRTDIYLQDVLVCNGGLAAEYPELELKQKLDASECAIRFVIQGRGEGHARFWTCDLTEKYIEINASYRT